MRSYSERDVFEKEDNEVVFSCPGLGIYSPEERKQVDCTYSFLTLLLLPNGPFFFNSEHFLCVAYSEVY